MKIKIRPHDPEMLQEPDWRQMNGWLAEIRDDDDDRSAGDDHARPGRGGDPGPEATAEPGATVEPACAEVPDGDAATVRPLIGDELRMPIMWCELGSCISWRTDPSALGEADARARAISAGWRIDALGRLACPECQQTDPGFWATRQVVRWDRHTAFARASAACGEGAVSQPATPYPRRWS